VGSSARSLLVGTTLAVALSVPALRLAAQTGTPAEGGKPAPGAATAAAATAAKGAALEVTGLSAEDPFKLSARADATRLTIRVAMRAGWHMYGKDTGGGVSVSVEVLDGSAFKAAGALQAPADAEGQLRGEFELVLPLARVAPGGDLEVRFSLMACDALQCLPPQDVELKASGIGASPAAAVLDRLKVLLVTPGDAARRDRIAGFLAARGFAASVADYDGVTAAQCDAVDLVVADSPNADKAAFSAAMKLGRRAEAFPETRTPIVAVGYLGTRLLEAHKLAMASGYI
jgi:hypothetical protein